MNVGKVFPANKKRGERGNAFKVVSHHGLPEKEKGILWTDVNVEDKEESVALLLTLK